MNGLHMGGEARVPNTNASRNGPAVFAELNLPFTRELETTLAARWDRYSDVGSKLSPQLRIRYTPTKELLFRGSIGKGFRAPSLWDLNSPPAFGNTANAVVDPGCPAALIADEDARCVDTQLNVRNIASTDLKPETSTQWSVGFVLEPIPSHSIAVDYWRIEKKDAIGSITWDPILGNANNRTLSN